MTPRGGKYDPRQPGEAVIQGIAFEMPQATGG